METLKLEIKHHLKLLKKEIFKCKSNKKHIGLVFWKLQNAEESDSKDI
jgi:hypothetical protein